MTGKKVQKSKGGFTILDPKQNDPAFYTHYNVDGLVNLNFGQKDPWPQALLVGGSGVTRVGAPDSQFVIQPVLPVDTSAFWEALQVLMNKLRAASGSNITYTINDLALYVLRQREMIKEEAIIERTILAARMVDPYDPNIGLRYAAMSAKPISGSVNIQTVVESLAQDTTEYNRLINIVASMAPLNVDLFKRTKWLYSHIFADAPTPKYSAKIVTAAHYQKWSINGSGKLVNTIQQYTTSLNPLRMHIKALQTLIDEFIGNQEMSRIAGDMMKAFGPSAFMVCKPILETDSIQPRYDELALAQLQNGSVLSDDWGAAVNVTSDPNTTTASISTAAGSAVPLLSDITEKLITTKKSKVTAGHALEITRLVAITSPSEEVDHDILRCGTETVNAMTYVYKMAASGANMVLSGFTIDPHIYTEAQITSLSATAKSNRETMILSWTRDDWGPELPLVQSGTLTGAVKGTLFDIDNWAIYSSADQLAFNAQAMLSLLATGSFLTEQDTFKFIM